MGAYETLLGILFGVSGFGGLAWMLYMIKVLARRPGNTPSQTKRFLRLGMFGGLFILLVANVFGLMWEIAYHENYKAKRAAIERTQTPN